MAAEAGTTGRSDGYAAETEACRDVLCKTFASLGSSKPCPPATVGTQYCHMMQCYGEEPLTGYFVEKSHGKLSECTKPYKDTQALAEVLSRHSMRKVVLAGCKSKKVGSRSVGSREDALAVLTAALVKATEGITGCKSGAKGGCQKTHIGSKATQLLKYFQCMGWKVDGVTAYEGPWWNSRPSETDAHLLKSDTPAQAVYDTAVLMAFHAHWGHDAQKDYARLQNPAKRVSKKASQAADEAE